MTKLRKCITNIGEINVHTARKGGKSFVNVLNLGGHNECDFELG